MSFLSKFHKDKELELYANFEIGKYPMSFIEILVKDFDFIFVYANLL